MRIETEEIDSFANELQWYTSGVTRVGEKPRDTYLYTTLVLLLVLCCTTQLSQPVSDWVLPCKQRQQATTILVSWCTNRYIVGVVEKISSALYCFVRFTIADVVYCFHVYSVCSISSEWCLCKSRFSGKQTSSVGLIPLTETNHIGVSVNSWLLSAVVCNTSQEPYYPSLFYQKKNHVFELTKVCQLIRIIYLFIVLVYVCESV